MSLLQKAQRYLSSRKVAYQQTFDPNSVAASAVLADLSRFCRGNKSTFHTNARMHAVLEGRREVLLRILNHLNLTDEQLYEIFLRKDVSE